MFFHHMAKLPEEVDELILETYEKVLAQIPVGHGWSSLNSVRHVTVQIARLV